MSENSSNASHEKGTTGSKFTSSTISENMKSGVLGDSPISVSEMAEPGRDTSASKIITDPGKGSDSFDGAKEITPGSKPSSSFINTSAVK